MLENSFYSVISPEGCASILFRDATKSKIASEKLKLTSKDIIELGIGDGIINEPLGGAHVDWEKTAGAIKAALITDLKTYSDKQADVICQERYDKFRAMGNWIEGK